MKSSIMISVPESSFVTYTKQRYFQSLDGVRFLSIIAVIWHHSHPQGLPEIFGRGFLGVDMFFVLSGYLIVTLLLREKDKHQTISLKNFYIRRALRIFPVYFGVLIALTLLYGLLKQGDPESETFFSLLPIYLAFVANWSLVHSANLAIYWSLATEEQFYLLWPLLEKFIQPKTILIILAVFIGINQLINFGFLDPFFSRLYGVENLDLSILDATFTPICLGVLLAHALHNKRSFLGLFRLIGFKGSSAAVFLLLITVIYLSTGDVSGWKRLCIQLTMCLWLASLVIREEHILQPIMTFLPFKRLGQISYGMYVYHMFALHIARVLIEKLGLSNDYILFILGLIITTVVAELSFRLYESPILSFNKRFRSQH